jgi:dTMP kinase
MKTKFKFITIEGGEGAGKSTFIPIIQNYLVEKGEQVVLTREPGGTPLGEKLRDLLLTQKMDTMAETLLMFAARAQHIEQVIKPALNEGKWVICDRFTDSTLAYQSAAKGLPESVIKTLQDVVQKELIPGITFVFDVPISIGKQRLLSKGKILDKFENEDDIFKENVNMGYKNIVKKQPSRCKLIDSSRNIEETKEQVMILLNQFYDLF